ncbi:hypothetical protein KJ359_010273 [Pestalotiopsis sp. 9143b]|nr:hypothetical protein KJ359_010273 [Pestalotiopsis sp. 9143b]
MFLSTAIVSSFALLSGATVTQRDEMELAPRATTGGVWFFADGCHDTDGYTGVPLTQGKQLTCMSGSTTDADGVEVEGPYTNVVTSNLEELGLKITLWNDTACTELITIVDADGCAVASAAVSSLKTRLNVGI